MLKVDADEAGIGGDDAADTCRYLVATKGPGVEVEKDVEWVVMALDRLAQA